MSKSYREDKSVELLLIGEGEKKEYVLIKDSKLLMLCIIIHFIVEQKQAFCGFCLQAFRKTNVMKCHMS